MIFSKSKIRMLVGLGNPGPQYAETRHNAGAWLIESFCERNRIILKPEAKFSARFGETAIGGTSVRFVISDTFMNHSGRAVGSIAKYFQIPPEAILVAHDELDLPIGVARFKTDGGHGGHNGLRDIIHHLQSQEFHRLRIGIGHPGHKDEVVDYVLNRPNHTEEKQIRSVILKTVELLPQIIKGDFEKAKNILHTDENGKEDPASK